MTRVSLGAQSFRPHLLDDARAAGPAGADRAAVGAAARGRRPKPQPRLDLWGSGAERGRPSRRPRRRCSRSSPTTSAPTSSRPSPGTRFTHAHGARARAAGRGAWRTTTRTVVATLRGGRLPLVRDGQLLPARATSAATTWATGWATTTWAWASARFRRSASSGAATGPACAATWRPSRPASAPPAEIELLTRRRARHRAADARPAARPAARAGRARRRCVDDASVRAAARRRDARRSGDGAMALTERGRFLANDVVASVLR